MRPSSLSHLLALLLLLHSLSLIECAPVVFVNNTDLLACVDSGRTAQDDVDEVPYCTVESAVAGVDAGGIVHLSPGEFCADDVVIDKPMEIRGAAYGSPLSSRAIPSPTTPNDPLVDSILHPCSFELLWTSYLDNGILQIGSDDVIIEGVVIDGHNAALSSGVVVNGVPIAAGRAIANGRNKYRDSWKNVANLQVRNNLLRNVQWFGLELWGISFSPVSGNQILHNVFSNIAHQNAPQSRAIALFNSQYADIQHNRFDRTWVAVQADTFQVAQGSPMLIENNTITNTGRIGVFANVWKTAAADLHIAENTLRVGATGIWVQAAQVEVRVVDNVAEHHSFACWHAFDVPGNPGAGEEVIFESNECFDATYGFFGWTCAQSGAGRESVIGFTGNLFNHTGTGIRIDDSGDAQGNCFGNPTNPFTVTLNEGNRILDSEVGIVQHGESSRFSVSEVSMGGLSAAVGGGSPMIFEDVEVYMRASGETTWGINATTFVYDGVLPALYSPTSAATTIPAEDLDEILLHVIDSTASPAECAWIFSLTDHCVLLVYENSCGNNSGLYRDQCLECGGNVTDPEIFPGQWEFCLDEIDNNCNGIVDENCDRVTVDERDPECNDAHGMPVYCTIQPAVDRVLPDGEVSVAPGTYCGNILISKPLSLRGAQSGRRGNSASRLADTTGINETIIAPCEYHVVYAESGNPHLDNNLITVVVDNVTVDGVWMQGWNHSLSTGISASSVLGTDVADSLSLSATDIGAGRGLSTGDRRSGNWTAISNLRLENSRLYAMHWYGVLLSAGNYSSQQPAGGNLLVNNDIRYMAKAQLPQSRGVGLAYSQYANVAGNNFEGNYIGVQADHFAEANPQGEFTISSNTFLDTKRIGVIYVHATERSTPLYAHSNILANGHTGIWAAQVRTDNILFRNNSLIDHSAQCFQVFDSLSLSTPISLLENLCMSSAIGLKLSTCSHVFGLSEADPNSVTNTTQVTLTGNLFNGTEIAVAVVDNRDNTSVCGNVDESDPMRRRRRLLEHHVGSVSAHFHDANAIESSDVGVQISNLLSSVEIDIGDGETAVEFEDTDVYIRVEGDNNRVVNATAMNWDGVDLRLGGVTPSILSSIHSKLSENFVDQIVLVEQGCGAANEIRDRCGTCGGTGWDTRIDPLGGEVCGDGIDNDCNGEIDEDCSIAPPSGPSGPSRPSGPSGGPPGPSGPSGPF